MRGKIPEFRSHLLQWFDEQQRPLPWRLQRSLYRTVVSEFMLQQTQMETVLPYFENWMARFPDFPSLARAPEATVLKMWEGLGYYSRARNLHRLAGSIVNEGVPTDVAGWLKRPGIGPYTAAAITSISQGIPVPVIDGNVIRVLSRLYLDQTPVVSSQQANRRLEPVARKLLEPSRPGDFNEAMMELGAIICRKIAPACLVCPIQSSCRALAAGRPESVPVIVPKKTRQREICRLWCLHQDRLLLIRYPLNSQRLAGLAELPEIPHPGKSKSLDSLSRSISSERIRESLFNLPPDHPSVLAVLKQKSAHWILLQDLPGLPLSGPHRRWISKLLKAPHHKDS